MLQISISVLFIAFYDLSSENAIHGLLKKKQKKIKRGRALLCEHLELL